MSNIRVAELSRPRMCDTGRQVCEEGRSFAREKPALFACGIFWAFIAPVGFAFSLLGVYESQIYEIDSASCANSSPAHTGLTYSIKPDKGWFNWNWRYYGQFDNGTSDAPFELKARCPSQRHNTELFIDGTFAGRTKKSWWATRMSDMDIYNCRGEKTFELKSGSWEAYFVNALSRNFHASYQITRFGGSTNSSGEVVAYIEGKKGLWLFGSDSETVIKDSKTGLEILRFLRPAAFFSGAWSESDWMVNITEYGATHPVADANVALLIIGQTSMELKNDGHGRRRLATAAGEGATVSPVPATAVAASGGGTEEEGELERMLNSLDDLGEGDEDDLDAIFSELELDDAPDLNAKAKGRRLASSRRRSSSSGSSENFDMCNRYVNFLTTILIIYAVVVFLVLAFIVLALYKKFKDNPPDWHSKGPTSGAGYGGGGMEMPQHTQVAFATAVPNNNAAV